MQQTGGSHKRTKILLIVLAVLAIGVVLVWIWRMNQEMRSPDSLSNMDGKHIQQLIQEQSKKLDELRSKVNQEQGNIKIGSFEEQTTKLDDMRNQSVKITKGMPTDSPEKQNTQLDKLHAESE